MPNRDDIAEHNRYSLRGHCYINTGTDGNSFVGIRSDNDGLSIYFPVGYVFPHDDTMLRRDVINLIGVLSRFSKVKDKNVLSQRIYSRETVDFPIKAYLDVMMNYRNANSTYYTETEKRYVKGTRGKKSWSRTQKRERPVIQDGNFIYLDFIVQETMSNDTKLITLVHEYCVYESYQKVGILFPGAPPCKPRIQNFDKRMFLGAIYQKKSEDNDDRNSALFDSMIAMINYLDDSGPPQNFYFGTDRFEYVWENLIDYTFGVDNKEWYFPRTNWMLLDQGDAANPALEPDTIMIVGNKVFVLDAKYYRYGDSKRPDHLPKSTSINKQITYGEYIATESKFKQQFGTDLKVYNAFLMPFGKHGKSFPHTDDYRLIGEAVSDWKDGVSEYEHVQGVLVDIRYLMHNYVKHNMPEIQKLADMIEKATDQSCAAIKANP